MNNKKYIRLTEDELLEKVQKSASSGPYLTFEEVKRYKEEAKKLGIKTREEYREFLQNKHNIKYFSNTENDNSKDKKE